MKNYAVLADLRVKASLHIEKAYDRGYDQGYNDCKVELLEDEAKCHYQEGYNDGYRKGVERGKEARVAEADCAYQCGMKRAWEAARKIVLSDADGGIPNDNIPKIYSTSYYGVMKNIPVQEAIAKLEAWEEKQKQDAPEMNVGNIENRDKIVKALAGLLAAYGEQLWDVVADMQKNP